MANAIRKFRSRRQTRQNELFQKESEQFVEGQREPGIKRSIRGKKNAVKMNNDIIEI